MWNAFVQALGLVIDPYVLWICFASAAFGIFVGAMPGLTATMATALLVPVTFFMPPVSPSSWPKVMRRWRSR